MAKAGTRREGRSGHECLKGSQKELSSHQPEPAFPNMLQTAQQITLLLAGRSSKEAVMPPTPTPADLPTTRLASRCCWSQRNRIAERARGGGMDNNISIHLETKRKMKQKLHPAPSC